MKLYSLDKIKTVLNASIEEAAFQIPYNGTNEFYDENKIKILKPFTSNVLSVLETLPSDLPSQSFENGEGWVSVDDRKPEINIESYNSDYSILVLGLSESGIQSGFFHKDKHSEFYSEDTESLVVGVTHWMYKPQPPTLTDH